MSLCLHQNRFGEFSITSLAHCSEWVPSEYKSKQLLKTSQKKNYAWSVQEDFFTGESNIMERGLYFNLVWKRKEKNILMDLFLRNLNLVTSQDFNQWTGVLWITCVLLWCFHQLCGFSFWRHPFNTEDPLMSKRWNFSKSFPMKKQTHLHFGWPEVE